MKWARVNEQAYLSDGTRRFALEGDELVIGRQPPASLLFPNPQVSRQHARLTRTPTGFLLADLGSRFGTFLNGRAVGEEPVELQNGDELVLGGALLLRFHDPGETREGRRVGRLKGVWIDPDSRDVFVNGRLLDPPLSAAQLALLQLLEARPGAFVTRDEVVARVWPDVAAEGVSEEAVDGLIKRLRVRLREHGPDPLEVRRGRGLRLRRAE